jgi:hypothetical protein
MSIQEFAAQLEQQENPSVLWEALKTLRNGDLEELRLDSGDFPGWPKWPDVLVDAGS